MKRLALILFISFLVFGSYAQVGNITDVKVAQRDDGSGMVDINFVLKGLASTFYNIDLEVSFDNGKTFQPISSQHLSGPLRMVKPSDEVLHVKWDGLASFPETYSEEAQLKFLAELTTGGTVTDIDGNVYRTVIIGDQEWMAENLRVTRNSAGVEIARYCFNNDPDNCIKHGGLYDWNTMMDRAQSTNENPGKVQGICPVGWHIPSDDEWFQLTNYLEEVHSIAPEVGGNALKSCRQVLSPLGGDCDTEEQPRWAENTNHFGSDIFGFSALPGGRRNEHGSFVDISAGIWWSATEQSSNTVWMRRINSTSGSVNRYISSNNIVWGLSVRCVKDQD